MQSPGKTSMPEPGVLDTSVLIDIKAIVGARLPDSSVITTITLAELAAGPHTTDDPAERAVRQERLQWAEATFDALEFDVAAARTYGRIYALVRAIGRQPRRRVADLQIASIAASRGLTLYTRNPADFVGLEDALSMVGI
jgi:predicted nucleic acid-binding protein